MSNLIPANEVLIKAELDVQITTAKAYPRNVERCIQEAMEMATIDEETAESCIYSLPRGKNDDGQQAYIKGESIRLAEIIVSAWGNIHCATRITENDGKTITAEGVTWDLEKNVKIAQEVKRSILDKYGKTFRPDMQVVTGNAASSIALRNSIFKVIPKVYVQKVYRAAVNFVIGDQTKLSQKIKSVFLRFQKLGIEKEKILNYFGKKEESAITADELEEMIGIGTAIKEKSLSIEKAFLHIDEASSSSKALELLEEKIMGNKNLTKDHHDFIKELG
jgi:hypothetical protein